MACVKEYHYNYMSILEYMDEAQEVYSIFNQKFVLDVYLVVRDNMLVYETVLTVV